MNVIEWCVNDEHDPASDWYAYPEYPEIPDEFVYRVETDELYGRFLGLPDNADQEVLIDKVASLEDAKRLVAKYLADLLREEAAND